MLMLSLFLESLFINVSSRNNLSQIRAGAGSWPYPHLVLTSHTQTAETLEAEQRAARESGRVESLKIGRGAALRGLDTSQMDQERDHTIVNQTKLSEKFKPLYLLNCFLSI